MKLVTNVGQKDWEQTDAANGEQLASSRASANTACDSPVASEANNNPTGAEWPDSHHERLEWSGCLISALMFIVALVETFCRCGSKTEEPEASRLGDTRRPPILSWEAEGLFPLRLDR